MVVVSLSSRFECLYAQCHYNRQSHYLTSKNGSQLRAKDLLHRGQLPVPMPELFLMFAKLAKPNWNLHGPLLLHVGTNIYPISIYHISYIQYPCQSKETPLVTKVLIGRVHNGWGALVQTLCWHGKYPRHVLSSMVQLSMPTTWSL